LSAPPARLADASRGLLLEAPAEISAIAGMAVHLFDVGRELVLEGQAEVSASAAFHISDRRT